jgi:BirA family biotin operon repressor/biotin-[acetyl-CoA-carboxylase] ligase
MHPTDLYLERVEGLLQTRRFGRSIEIRESTDSTNDDARAAAQAGAVDGHVVVADTQRQGRGARGRSWSSPAGSDLYLSVVAQSTLPLQEMAPLTLAVGLGVAETVQAFLPVGKTAQIKWPNDVWVDRKKIAGILLEGTSQGQTSLPIIIGIGLNVNRREFPADLDTPPSSLALEHGRPLDRAEVLATLLARVEHWFDSFVAGGKEQVIAALNARLCLRGELARCDDAVGVVQGVAASGALLMTVDGQPRELYAGTLRPIA